MRVALISCSKTKKAGLHKAKDLYNSLRFRYALQYAVRDFDAVYILSAKHGLLHLEQRIKSYNHTLNTMPVLERKSWAEKVAQQLQIAVPDSAEIYLFCGQKYREFLPDLLPQFRFSIPLEGMKIGEQLRWYKERHS